MGVPELLVHALTGVHCTEPSLASRTGAWRVVDRQWDAEVLAAAGVPQDFFGPEPTTSARMAPTGTAWSRALFPDGVPVIVAGHDHPVGTWALPARGDDVVDSIGTAEQLFRRVDGPIDAAATAKAGLELAAAPVRGWAVTACRRRPGVELAALAGQLGFERDRIEMLAAHAPAHHDDQLTEATDAWLSRRSSSLPDADPVSLWVAGLAALARDAQEMTDRMAIVLGPASRLILTGGGVRSSRLVHEKRALTDLMVTVDAAQSASATGAALIASNVVDWWSPDA
jgi:sugar (pentulose or hexulose) kinase